MLENDPWSSRHLEKFRERKIPKIRSAIVLKHKTEHMEHMNIPLHNYSGEKDITRF